MNVSRPVNGIERLLKSLNCDGKLGIALLAACAVLLLPVLAGDAGREALRYDRTALAAGQEWRLLTAHFVHLDFDHAALNSLGLVLMWALFARDYRPRQWLAILLGSIAAIDAIRQSPGTWVPPGRCTASWPQARSHICDAVTWMAGYWLSSFY